MQHDSGGARITLADGAEILIRPIGPDDKERVREGFQRLSPESRYRRFLTAAAHLSDEDLAFLTEVDHHRHEALIAIDVATGQGLGVARYVRVAGQRDTADVAVAVVDDWHGRGVGGALMRELSGRALEEGIRRYTALVAADNRRVVDLLARLGAVRRASADASTIEFEIPVPADGLDERLRRALRAAASYQLRLERAVIRRGQEIVRRLAAAAGGAGGRGDS